MKKDVTQNSEEIGDNPGESREEKAAQEDSKVETGTYVRERVHFHILISPFFGGSRSLQNTFLAEN